MTATTYFVRRSPAGGINITTDTENVVSFGSGLLGQVAYDIWKEGLAVSDWHASNKGSGRAILLDEDGTVLVGDVGDLAP